MKLFQDYEFSRKNPEFFYFVKILPSPKNEPELLPPIYMNSLSVILENPKEDSNNQKKLPSLNSRILQLFNVNQDKKSSKEVSVKIEGEESKLSDIISVKSIDPRVQELDHQLEILFKIVNRDDSEFITFKEKKDYKLSKIIEDNNPVVLIKGREIYDTTPDMVLESLIVEEKRTLWDKVLKNSMVLEKIDDNTEIIYNSTIGVMGTSPRDFVQIRKVFKENKDYEYIILQKSIEHELKPPLKKKVRAKCIIGGYLIKSLGPDKTEMVVVMQVDVNGLLPKFLVNSFAPSKTHEWFKDFKKFINKSIKEKQ
jgi:hypothetical protein